MFGLHIRERIAYEPIPKSAQCTPKCMEKTSIYKTHCFFTNNTRNNQETCLKQVPKWVSLFQGVYRVFSPQFAYWSLLLVSKKLQPRCSSTRAELAVASGSGLGDSSESWLDDLEVGEEDEASFSTLLWGAWCGQNIVKRVVYTPWLVAEYQGLRSLK